MVSGMRTDRRLADLEADVELITVMLRALDAIVAALYRQRAERMLVEGAPARRRTRARA